MDNRFKMWISITLLLFIINFWIQAVFFPQKPPAADKAVAQADKDGKKAAAKPGDKAVAKPGDQDKPAQPDDATEDAAEKPGDDKPADDDEPADKPADDVAAAPAEGEIEPTWISLGSADPASPYRMVVTLTNVGAAVERVELNSPRYRDIDDRSGYVGHLALADVPKLGGALVRVVGEGTPAWLAGIRPGDVIIEAGGKTMATGKAFVKLLQTTRPNQTLEIAVQRDGKRQQFTATLIRRPLEIMRPELDTKPLDFVAAGKHDPFSMLLTLQTLDAAGLIAPEKGGPGEELPGLKLWTTPWEVADQGADHVTFRKPVTGTSLVIEKQFRLAKAENATQQQSITSPVFHMDVQVRITNNGQTPHTVAYQLDGPNGLPAEGAWYATKVSRNWSSAGLRDVIVRFVGQPTTEVGCHTIAQHEFSAWPESPLEYIAVDAQYFSAAMIPLKKQVDDSWFSDTRPLRVGEVPKDRNNLKMTNVSFRLTSKPQELTEGKSLAHEYRLFMGPKRPALLEQYATVPPNPAHPITLEDLVYYGWFGWVAKPMLWVLHGFYNVVMNYGIAIILLTVLVRGAMFPISRKQAIAAQKMQELQPQIKAIAEKYKSNPQERQHAQMELFRKHNYNPFAGCLPIFIQMPIFIGLYRSLMVDVELRDAPLISEWIRWCSNLAAPDMLFDWSRFMPDFVNSGQGFFGLGPYFNILPIFTVLLFLWQQKMFMPPPTDEQTAMQQKMMQYMMVFMGLMFFKVASGLCLYFIASSLWGITERKLLPKTLPKNPTGEAVAEPQIASGNGNNKSPKQKRKQRN